MMPNKKTTILILSILISFTSFAQNKQYQSRFWKISKEGRPDSYLYGTMHVSDKIAFNLSDSFYKAVQSVKTVGLESNPSQWLDSFNTFQNSYTYEGAPRFSTYASAGYYQRSVVLRKVENDDISSWLKTKSGILNAMLYRENSYNKEYQEDTWLEMHIYQVASKNNIPVVSLEGFTESRELVSRASFEDSKDKTKTVVPKWLEDILEEKNRYTLIEDAYRAGDLDMIDTINRVFNSSGYYKYMLTERNRNMVRRFRDYEAAGPVFMAVGAAHLPGRDGVIEMLRAQGYTVTPITDGRTDFAKKEKERLDSLVSPISLSKEEAPNGTFSMIWPGKLYGSTSGYTNATLGYDLGNGMYFLNQQFNTYGPFYGLSPEQMLMKTDSLFFENIPGNIKSKTRITTNGIPGFEIKNVTRTGDYEQYRVYATPYQLSLFKLSGRNTRIKVMGDSIFSTLKLMPLSDDWSTLKFVSGQFEINVPEYHTMNLIDPIQTMYSVPYLQAWDKSDDSYYLVKRLSLHDVNYIEEDKFEVKRFAEKLIEKMEYETISLETSDYNGLPVADFTAKTKFNTYVHGRFLIQGPYYYMLICINGKKKFGPAKFFNSFQVLPTVYQLPSEQFMDTVIKASVYASPLLNKRYLFERESSYSAKESDYKSITDSKRYYSENDELILVSREVYGKYDFYDKPDSLWSEIVKKYTEKKPYFKLDSHSFVKNRMRTFDVFLTDTGSVKQIHHRYILSRNEDVMFELSTLYDTITGRSVFVKNFYDRFEPMDTVIRPSIFSNKARILITDYLSKDENTHKDALDYLTGYNFWKRPELEDTDLALMKRAILENSRADKESFTKTIFIKMLGDIKTDSAAMFLNSLYYDNDDNYPVQIEALSSLAKIKTEKASACLKQILEEDVPYISLEQSFLFFQILNDSARIENQLYATLLEKMPDVYKDVIYKVLGWVVADTSSRFKPEYAQLLPDIIKRYKFELKKYRVGEQVEKMEKEKRKSRGSSSYSYYSYSRDDDDMFSSGFNMRSSGSLFGYYILLLPFDSVPEISALLNQANELTSYSNVKNLMEIRMMYQKKIQDSIASHLFEDDEKIVKAYAFLQEIKRTELLPDTLQNYDRFVKYCLVNRGRFDIDKDTIKLVKTEENVSGKKGEMKLYYYQIREYKDPKKTSQYKMNDPSYKLVSVGFVKNADGSYPTKTDFYESTSVDSEEKLQDAFDELKEAAQIDDRRRAKPSKGNSSRNSYYYGY
ncbi:MAG: hypothetical protein GC181_08010 [Bacteroidetes bacterium]|nr:hypothetical protein [Bacteroidota bacterium]